MGGGRESAVKIGKLSAFSLAVILLLLGSYAQGQEGAAIKQIDILGSRRVDEGTIRFKLKTKVGEPFSVERLREDVKALYKLGFYDDISVESETFEGGLKLTFVFKEKPAIRSVRFQGNKGVKTEKLKEKIDLAEGGIASSAALSQNSERLRLFYEEEGYYLAKVEPVVERVSEREADVIFRIQEGEKFKLGEIRIVGAKGLKEKAIKKKMATKERYLLFFGGTLKREELKRDMDRIRAFYLDNGYLDIKVEEPQIALDLKRKRLVVSIRVEEGPQYKLGEVKVSGNTVFSTEEVLKALSIRARGIFSREVLQADLLRLTDRYAERGYLFADIAPNIKVDRERQVVDITLEVNEGRQAFVERIEISGNTRTRDKVIRREIYLVEGDVFNSRFLALSQRNLNNLGFFEDVRVETKRGSDPDKVRVEVTVKERPTGTFAIGGGFSSAEGLIFVTSLSQANLFGFGQRVALSAQLGTRINRYNFRFADPHILDTDNSLDLSLFNTRRSFREFVGFDEDAKGGSVGIGRRLYERIFGVLSYRYEDVKVFNLETNAPTEVRLQEGKSTTSSVGLSFTRDTRDNPMDPTRGLRLAASTEVAGGALGGDNFFTKYSGEASYFHLLFWKFIGHLRGNITLLEPFGGRELPIQEKIFLGGPNTIRGFRNFSISPIDPETGGRLGGSKAFFTNAELIFPITALSFLDMKGVVFFDAGNVFDDDLRLSFRTSAGLGVRLRTPLAPIRVEWGYNLSPKPGESSSQFHFTVGTAF